MKPTLATISVTLIRQTQTGTDDFGAPIYTETEVAVPGCLVGQPTTDEITDTTNLYGKSVDYMLGIPKDDTNDWRDAVVELPAPWSGRFRSIGMPVFGVPALMPMSWKGKVRLERYECEGESGAEQGGSQSTSEESGDA